MLGILCVALYNSNCEASLTPLPFLGVSSLMNCRALGSGFFFGLRL